jgi:hypothetical protein
MRSPCIATILLASSFAFAAHHPKASPAPTPPMGWNSWDSYGFTIDEQQFRANLKVLRQLRAESSAAQAPSWQYAVIDEGWYFRNPRGQNAQERDQRIDANGRLVPVSDRFPSGGAAGSFTRLAAEVHAAGLKFGIHIVRGIPRNAVDDNVTIAGTNTKIAEAADTSDVCQWDQTNYGVRDNAAGQAYYDSLLALYATWGVDFLKVDCIADHPYKPAEIRMIASAIRKTGRPIVLSLSPGPVQLQYAHALQQQAQMWRIADDLWDLWGDNKGVFPNGVYSAFDNLAAWEPYAHTNSWPDADMLPIGSLKPSPGWGAPRESRLTHDEVRTQLTLWSIARSPMILGANLTELDGFTRSVITNKDLVALNQADGESRERLRQGTLRVWTAERAGGRHYVAVFNTGETPLAVNLSWKELGMPFPSATAQSLWDGVAQPRAGGLQVTLAPHASQVYRVSPGATRRP